MVRLVAPAHERRYLCKVIGAIVGALLMAFILAACTSVSKQAGVADSSTDAANLEAKQWKPETWMGDLFDTGDRETRGKAKLKQLAIPGTHDSHAYKAGEILNACGANVFNHLADDTTRQWARTQTDNLYDQARQGMRVFDIRPVVFMKKGEKLLSTCHTAEGATMDEVFSADYGLERFARENPREVSIINLSHFKWSDSYTREEAIDTLAEFVNAKVCKRAVLPTGAVPKNPGDIELNMIWRFADPGRQYIVGADEKLYPALWPKVKCLFKLWEDAGTLRGGYAADSTAAQAGDDVKMNLWHAMYWQEDVDKVYPIQEARAKTEELLMGNLKPSWQGLSETSYIWVYGSAGIGDVTAARVAMTSNLVAETERYLINNAEAFVRALDKRATDLGTNVNIVNIDAAERGKGQVVSELVSPLMTINQRIAPKKPAPPARAGYALEVPGKPYCVGTAYDASGQIVRLVPCEVNDNAIFEVKRDGGWQTFELRNGYCLSKYGEKAAKAERCDENSKDQQFRWVDSVGVQSASDNSKCLDVVHYEMGSDLEFHRCHAGKNQMFNAMPEDFLRFEDDKRLAESKQFSVKVSGKKYCWAVTEPPPLRRGIAVETALCDGKARNQKFTIEPAKEPGTYALRHRGMCVDQKKADARSVPLLWDCHGEANQTFNVIGGRKSRDDVRFKPLSDKRTWIFAEVRTRGPEVVFSIPDDTMNMTDEWSVTPEWPR